MKCRMSLFDAYSLIVLFGMALVPILSILEFMGLRDDDTFWSGMVFIAAAMVAVVIAWWMLNWVLAY